MKRVDLSHVVPKTYRLYLIGDTHVGNEAFAENVARKAIQRIKRDPKGYVGFMGDGTESIHPFDKRFDIKVHGKAGTANRQVDFFVKMFKPIADRILFYLTGNHEWKLSQIVDIPAMIAEKLNPKMIHSTWTVKAKFSDDFRLWATHGRRAVNSYAKTYKERQDHEADRVKKLLQLLQGDCMVMAMGHIHKMRIHEPVHDMQVLGDDELRAVYTTIAMTPEGGIQADYRWYCSCGSFLRTYVDDLDTYGEIAMYPPVEMGFIRISVVNGKVDTVEKVPM